MTPYYQDDRVTIYHGDASELLGLLMFDAIVTDPPYGIALNTDYSKLNGSTRTYSRVVGDNEPFDPEPLLATGVPCVLFGADHYAHRLPPGGTFHVWDKRVTARSNMFADCEMWWTSYKSSPSRVFRYQWICGTHPGAKRLTFRHPTVKPEPVMMYAMAGVLAGSTVLDPFMGSGTTLAAARTLGHRAIGIEIDERYCEIAARRLSQEVLDLGA